MENRRNEIFIGLLFLSAIVAYGTGTAFVDSILNTEDNIKQLFLNKTKYVTGSLLMLSNSVVVIAIGILFYPILEKINKTIANTYFAVRLVEGILLAFGVINLLTISIVSELSNKSQEIFLLKMVIILRKFNFFSYQLAMLSLGFGSLFFCFSLFKSKIIPRTLSVWGLIGYFLLFLGSVLELFGYEVGLILCIPGGLFEIVLPFWLFFKGFNLPIVNK